MHDLRADDPNEPSGDWPSALHKSAHPVDILSADGQGTLHQMVDQMTEEEAEATLQRIDLQAGADPLVRFFDAAPVDDEPVNAEEEAAVAEVFTDRPLGVPTIPFDEVRREYAG